MTSSQWLDLAVLAIAFVAAVSGWRSGALGSLMSFVGRGARRGGRRTAGAARRRRTSAAPHQAVRHAVPDPRAGGDRRDRGRGAGPRGARSHPQPRAARPSTRGRGGAAGGGGAGGGVAAGHPADVRRTSRIWPRPCGVRRCSRRSTRWRRRWLQERCRSGCRRCWTPPGCPMCSSSSAAPRSSRWSRRTPRWPPAPWSPPRGRAWSRSAAWRRAARRCWRAAASSSHPTG